MESIKVVKALDKTGPGENGENFEVLWRAFSSEADSPFHAAEESTLRRLLKSMSGGSTIAETTRRYPLAWMLLSTIFQRMPLLPLAKSLADKRFINILQQTLKDLAQPDDEDEVPVTNGKRKRSQPTKFDLQHLKNIESRLEVTQALCRALKTLLDKLDIDGEISTQAKNGSEHLKSIFSISADEAVKIVSPLLMLSNRALESEEFGQIEGLKDWSTIISAVWDLHLHNEQDASIYVGPTIFSPASSVLAKCDFSKDSSDVLLDVRSRWSSDIRTLLERTLAQPAKAAFLRDGSFAIVEATLESNGDRLDTAVPALYRLITSSLTPESKRQRGERAWLQKSFKALVESAERHQGSTAILRSLLQRAQECSTPVEVDHLRQICRGHALSSTKTDWDIISLAVSCDPDLFQITDEAKQLLLEVCARIREEGPGGSVTPETLDTVADGIFRGFKTSRDVPGFLKLWYSQLLAIKDATSWAQSPWLRFGRSISNICSNFNVERDISLSQFEETLETIMSETPSSPKPAVLAVFLDTVTQLMEMDVFRDVLAEKLFDISQQLEDTVSQLAALKWRLTSRSMRWLEHSQRANAWNVVEKPLSKILRKGKIASATCFEAFKCCCHIWTATRSDRDLAKQPAAIIESFSERLSTFVKETGAEAASPKDLYELAVDRDLLEAPTASHYIGWCSRVLSPLVHMKLGTEQPEFFVPRLAKLAQKFGEDLSGDVWSSILNNDQTWKNEVVAPTVVDQLIAEMKQLVEKSKSSTKWSTKFHEQIELLIKTPSEVLTRPQREEIMVTMAAFATKLDRSVKHVKASEWICYLDLVTKIMSEPTFYQGMHFKDLSNMADALTSFVLKVSPDDRSYLQFIHKYDQVADTTLAQMLEARDRSVEYFRGAAEWIAGFGKAKKLNDVVSLRLTLMKVLIHQLERSSRCKEFAELEKLRVDAQNSLCSNMVTVLSNISGQDTLFSDASRSCIFELYAVWDASRILRSGSIDCSKLKLKEADGVKLDKDSFDAARKGNIRGWVMQHLLRRYLPQFVEVSLPTTLTYPQKMPSRVAQLMIERFTSGVLEFAQIHQKVDYVNALLKTITINDADHMGQLLMLDHVVLDVISDDSIAADRESAAVLVNVYSEVVAVLSQVQNSADGARICEILQRILDSTPQALSQWNLELTLQSITTACATRQASNKVPYQSYCKLIATILKKHRHRLEGHFHLLVATLEGLLVTLVALGQRLSEATHQSANKTNAALYRRVITMICEPTSGSVARLHQHSALDTAVDVAKKSASRYMYLVLIRYIKLQLDTEVTKEIQDALDPAVNSILNITSSDGRKILHDLMDPNGRAIGREMFRRYTKFGKWTGI